MRKLFLIIIFLGWIPAAGAADINVCTLSELTSAIGSAKPGDDIVMCNRRWSDLRLTFEVDGTAANPITLRAQTPGKTLITGRSQILMAGNYAVVRGLRFQDGGPYKQAISFRKSSSAHCNNCRLTETTFIDYTTDEAANDFSFHEWYVMVNGRNNRVDHNYFSGKRSRGQYLNIPVLKGSKENHRIDHNYFGHRPKHPSGNDGETIKIGGHPQEFNLSGTIIESNYFERANGDFEIMTVKGSEITIRRNTFDRCEGGLSLRHGRGNWIDANTFLGHRDPSKKVSGISVYGEDHVITNNYISGIHVGTHDFRGGINIGGGDAVYREGGRVPSKNILVAFNTIVDSDRSIGFNLTQAVKPSNVTIANNIIVSTHGPLFADAGSIAGLSFSKNLLFGANVGLNRSGLTVIDPKIVLSGGIHRLSDNSPARNDADSNYTPMSRLGSSALFIDSEQQSRSGSYDIGADEYVGGAGLGYTKKCDTGPRTYNPTTSSNCVGDPDAQTAPMPPTFVTSNP